MLLIVVLPQSESMRAIIQCWFNFDLVKCKEAAETKEFFSISKASLVVDTHAVREGLDM